MKTIEHFHKVIESLEFCEVNPKYITVSSYWIKPLESYIKQNYLSNFEMTQRDIQTLTMYEIPVKFKEDLLPNELRIEY